MTAAVSADRRIALLDACRGLGVLGILPCNIPDFAIAPAVSESAQAWPHGHGPATLWLYGITQVLFQRKFIGLFAMLFGVSVLLVGGERGDRVRGPMLARRLGLLLLFGTIHGLLIWWGDILFSYAICGVVLFFCRSWPPGRLLRVGVSVFAVFMALNLVGGSAALATGHIKSMVSDPAKDAAEGAGQALAFSGGFVSSLQANAVQWLHLIPFEAIGVTLFYTPFMMVGLASFRWGVFTGEAPRGVYLALAGATAMSAALVGVTWAVYLMTPGFPVGFAFLARSLQMSLSPVMALGYAAVLALASASRLWRFAPNLLAPVGQMAFTNYITQSVLMTALFYGGRGPGLFGRLDRPALALVVLGVWALQIAWSHLWLRHFRTGPLEWGWRRLYAGPHPLRHPAPAPEVVPA